MRGHVQSISSTLAFPLLLLAACGSESAPPAIPAATVHAIEETSLNTLTLSTDAERRLAIAVAPAELREVVRTRVLGGEVIIPFEREIIVTAPVAGTVMAPQSGAIPKTGSTVRRGDPIVRMLFLPSGGDLPRARERLAVAQAEALAARREAARADSLIRERFITAVEHDRAQTALAVAEAELSAARAAAVALGDTTVAGADLAPMVVTAPSDGVLWQVWVGEGQTVAASAPLFEVIDLDPVWIRVPVYAGDAPTVDRGANAMVRMLGADGSSAGLVARPIPAPPSADPLTASIDLFYELRNTDRAFRPHQRVAVAVPMASAEEALVVPWSAVVYDIQGGTWVYVRTGPQTYERRRIEVRYVADGVAVLSRGPAPGTEVVSVGAAELFGTEFGVAH